MKKTLGIFQKLEGICVWKMRVVTFLIDQNLFIHSLYVLMLNSCTHTKNSIEF